MKKRGGRRMGVGGERERERLIIKAEYINIREYVFFSPECNFPIYSPLENKRRL